MAQTVVINGVTYQDVPSVKIPLSPGPGDATFYDTSSDTVTASDMLNGVTAHGASGAVTGNIVTKTGSDLSASGATVTVPAGYYASQQTKSVATATLATPTISVNTSTGVITAEVDQQSEGYISASTKTATQAMTTKAAATITPTTTDQTIAAQTYLTGAQTIKGDADLVTGNIKSGVTIFGVAGATNVVDTTIASSAITSSQVLSGYKGYANGSLVEGTMTAATVSQDSSTKVLSIS